MMNLLSFDGRAVGPYSSPLLSVREQDFRAPGIASFFIDNLVIWGDPRLDIPTYGTNGINKWGIAAYQGAFLRECQAAIHRVLIL
jgi:hypothetical protein